MKPDYGMRGYDGADEGHSIQKDPTYLYESCNGCNTLEDPEILFEHEASGEKMLCQDCLCRYLRAGIETDGKDYFRGWEFKPFGSSYQAVRDSDGLQFIEGKLETVLEHVLSRLKLI